MTHQERLLALVHGQVLDCQASIGWPGPSPLWSDAVVVPHRQISDSLGHVEDRALLAEITSPFGKALKQGFTLNRLFQSDSHAADSLLDSLAEECKFACKSALENGADGIFYRLHGATLDWSTPMEYGGRYLERDREILSLSSHSRLSVLFVVGGAETFFDCVSDLESHLFGWDIHESNVGVSAMRKIRKGLLLCDDSLADVRLVAPSKAISRLLEDFDNASIDLRSLAHV